MDPIEYIFTLFDHRGDEKYASEQVNQLEHALQTASLAQESQSSPSLVVAALLHDVGHIMSQEALPEDDQMDLHDEHELRAFDFLLAHFGSDVAEPAKLHVAAKRYLCTTDPSYFETLSPTSQKSYDDRVEK